MEDTPPVAASATDRIHEAEIDRPFYLRYQYRVFHHSIMQFANETRGRIGHFATPVNIDSFLILAAEAAYALKGRRCSEQH